MKKLLTLDYLDDESADLPGEEERTSPILNAKRYGASLFKPKSCLTNNNPNEQQQYNTDINGSFIIILIKYLGLA